MNTTYQPGQAAPAQPYPYNPQAPQAACYPPQPAPPPAGYAGYPGPWQAQPAPYPPVAYPPAAYPTAPYAPACALPPAFTPEGKPTANPQRKAASRTLNRMCLLVLAQAGASILWQFLLVFGMASLGAGSLDGMAISWLSAALVPLSTALPFFLYMAIGRRDTVDYLKFQRVGFFPGLLCVLAGLSLAQLANYPTFMFQEFLQGFGYESASAALDGGAKTWGGFALDFAVVAVMVPFLEEFAFRGVLVSALRPYGIGFAIVASALVFGFAHLDGPTSLFAILAGLVLGFIYARTNNLWLTIWIHALNNGLSTIGSYSSLFVPEAYVDAFSALLLLGPIALGLLALLLLAICKRGMFITRQSPLYDGPAQPLGLGGSAGAILRAPLLWGVAAMVVAFTLPQML